MNSTASTSPDGTPDHRVHVVAAIVATAPDVVDDIETVGDDVDVFEEFGLDSMDRINIMTALAASTGVAIPDDVYTHLNTMGQLIGHIS